jgi:two-component system sensor histidine kinase RegB
MHPSSGSRDVAERSLRLDTLVKLRWLAVGGQTVTVLFVYFGLGFEFPFIPCLALVAVSALSNLLLRLRFEASRRLLGAASTVLLGYDVLQLAALLYLTGGLANPFALLLLAPVMVSAATLKPRSTIFLGTLVVLIATLLAVVHMPLPWGNGPAPDLPALYLVGIWIALVLTLVFSGTYAFRVAEEARLLAGALSAAEFVLQREQHLTALDGLAAAAAHELGTPLGTIAVVTRELERELPPGSPLADDIALLRTQSERCREILRKLTTLSTDIDSYFVRMPLSSLIEEVAAPFREFGVEIELTKVANAGPEPVGERNPAILYGLGNIVENAMDFARRKVDIVAAWDDRTVTVTISDDGPGFAPEIIDRIGEPYVTTRDRAPRDRGGDTGGGLGLGYFIAKTLLKRSGANMAWSNRKPPDTGAVITITWPRAAMEGPPKVTKEQGSAAERQPYLGVTPA